MDDEIRARFRFSSRVLFFFLHVTACTAAVSPERRPATDGGDLEAGSPCSRSGDAYEGALARTSSGGTFVARLLSVDPEPPAMGKNAWRLSLRDAVDQPMTGAPVVITSFMPDHAHPGPSIDVSESGQGEYQATMSIVLMSGLYDFNIALGSNRADSAAYEFCVR